jgi:hypothetical protein
VASVALSSGGRGADVLRVAAAARCCEDGGANAGPGGAFTDGGHRAGDVGAGDERQRGRLRVGRAAPAHGVGEVDPGGFDAKKHFALSGRRHRNLVDDQDVCAAGSMEPHGLHGGQTRSKTSSDTNEKPER